MGTLVNVNHAISIVGYWIFDSNKEKALFMTSESLDLIWSPSVGEEQLLKFETVFYAVRYMWSPGNLISDKHEGVSKTNLRNNNNWQ